MAGNENDIWTKMVVVPNGFVVDLDGRVIAADVCLVDWGGVITADVWVVDGGGVAGDDEGGLRRREWGRK